MVAVKHAMTANLETLNGPRMPFKDTYREKMRQFFDKQAMKI